MKKNNVIIAICVSLLCLCWAGFKRDNHNFQVSKNLDVFNSVYKELDMFYVDTIDPQKVIRAGIDAMLEEIDPYTVYYPEDDLDDLKQMITGKYAGIGSIIRYYKKRERVVIFEPYEDTPAAEAGLKAGDVILEIDGKDVKGLMTDKVSEMLRGEAGTTFILKVERPGEAAPLEFRITRRNIQTPAVPYYGMLTDGKSGYVQLTSFTDNCARDVRRAIIELKEQGASQFVLDLRSNGGGSLKEAVEIVNLFVPKGLELISTKGKMRQACHVYKSTREPLDLKSPLAVLVDGASASAAEIVAGSLQDLDRAVIVGTRTYGKGLVQIPRDLPYNGQLKVTTSKYYIPSGRCIQALDYQHRDEKGQAIRTPDSLTNVFYTAAGREVRDGGGIRPDVAVEVPKQSHLLYYLLNDDVLLEYGNEYALSHPTIAGPQEFELTDEDYEHFKKMVLESGFKYDRQSEKALKELKEVAKFEGYLENAQAEFDALEKKLQHNLSADLDRLKKEIKPLIASEIVKRYYFQRGVIIQQLKDDTDLDKALEVLGDSTSYAAVFAVKK
ncbi:MAG: S41 family peptidase [Bacteroidaceae bacterium]|nr:S41 family peptidase [Bacteroidaceae bacterium]MBQ6799504.1 S41 family peptidase [Bacteroidaceae bacterium]